MSELLLDGETYDYLWLTDRSHPKAQQRYCAGIMAAPNGPAVSV